MDEFLWRAGDALADAPVKRPRKSHVFARQAGDHYAEPGWVSERLFEVLGLRPGSAVLDPACGFGRIPWAAYRAGLVGLGADIVPRWEGSPDHSPPTGASGPDFTVCDFLVDRRDPSCDAIVCNPPFLLAEAFVTRALACCSLVALLLPTRWIQGDRRSRWLETTPLERLMPITPRPSMPPGHVWQSGGPTSGGTVDFSWFVWRDGHRGPPVVRHLRREP